MSPDRIFEVVVGCTRDVIPELSGHAFQRTDSLRDLGATSVDRADIVIAVLEVLRLDVPRVELLGPTNLGELVELLHAKLRRS